MNREAVSVLDFSNGGKMVPWGLELFLVRAGKRSYAKRASQTPDCHGASGAGSVGIRARIA
ncbi:MAG TPA: hypothetical protein VN936_10305, partial [Candidatus Acidoferrum sp.]|nr:hypothetical protein [Candidatus Acidoferrum sp.]